MTMDYETLALTRPADGVAVLTLTRPRQRNAITFQMFDEMHDLLAKVRKDESIRALIVTGEGQGFCAGLDLDDAEELPRMSANEMMLGQEHWAGAFERFHDLPQAVIAAVNGAAAGGGLGLAPVAYTHLRAHET
jgi:enoyl-CoA hydratase/carnithine racemase